MPFGRGVRIDEEPLVWVISVWPSYSYRDTPSKLPLMETRPKEDRSKSGSEIASNDKALAVGNSVNNVDKPAAAGPNNEDLIV